MTTGGLSAFTDVTAVCYATVVACSSRKYTQATPAAKRFTVVTVALTTTRIMQHRRGGGKGKGRRRILDFGPGFRSPL